MVKFHVCVRESGKLISQCLSVEFRFASSRTQFLWRLINMHNAQTQLRLCIYIKEPTKSKNLTFFSKYPPFYKHYTVFGNRKTKQRKRASSGEDSVHVPTSLVQYLSKLILGFKTSRSNTHLEFKIIQSLFLHHVKISSSKDVNFDI